MTQLRSLPIRVAPLPGEALDSWLDALAFRMHMPTGDLLASVGLTRHVHHRTPGGPRPNWMTRLYPDEACTIAMTTGTTAAQVTAMTLSAYDGRALIIDQNSGQVNRKRLWGRNAGSRYCPSCLAETDGRWSLSWRLGWSFACLRHQCLLTDACPKCNRIQHVYRFRGHRHSHPALCGYPAPGSTASIRCGADLREAVPVWLGRTHPVLDAQRIVLKIIETDRASFGAYTDLPTAAVDALADIKAIAGRALAPRNAHALSCRLPTDLLDLYRKALAEGPANQRSPHAVPEVPGFMAPSHAVITAAGALAALEVLGQRSVQEAGRALRWLTVDAQSAAYTITPSGFRGWGTTTSPVLTGVALASMRSALRPSNQLRYRAMSTCPAYPGAAPASLEVLARSTPTLMWPYWTLRLASPGTSMKYLRAVLSALVLLAGTGAKPAKATAILGRAIGPRALSTVLQRMEGAPQWEQVIAAILRLADYLTADPAPIDYQRRRELDYSRLLPSAEWDQICQASGTQRGRHKEHVARAYLFHKISSLPYDTRPAGLADSDPAFREDVTRFPVQLFPELSTRLDNAAHRFLASCGITREPLTWQPPLDLADGLNLLGPDPGSVRIDDLHELIRGGKAPSQVAQALGTTGHVVRAILAENPAPAHGRVVQCQHARTVIDIPKHEIERLYLHERLSIAQIAALLGARQEAVTRLFASYGIPIGPRPPTGVTQDWLRREYVEHGRTFNDLAAEVGSSPTSLALWAKKWGLPVRPRGMAGNQAAARARLAAAVGT